MTVSRCFGRQNIIRHALFPILIELRCPWMPDKYCGMNHSWPHFDTRIVRKREKYLVLLRSHVS
jgi:hypothetical protein